MEGGYGLFSCYNNPLSVDNNLQYFNGQTDNYFNTHYTQPARIPTLLFGNIYSRDPEEATAFIAGMTTSALVNSLRVFVSYTPIHRVPTVFRKFFPDPSHCPSLPSPNACSCIPQEGVVADGMDYNHYIRYNATACVEEEEEEGVEGGRCAGITECAQLEPSFDFQIAPRSEYGMTSNKLDIDGTPLLERIPLLSFARWFHDTASAETNNNNNNDDDDGDGDRDGFVNGNQTKEESDDMKTSVLHPHVLSLPRLPRAHHLPGERYHL